jgi:hypothetical protein
MQPKTEGIQRACSTSKRSSSVPDSPAAAKKPRIETPPALPTFKVCKIEYLNCEDFGSYALDPSSPQVTKEKLGDRITALQQLVSPFGKVPHPFCTSFFFHLQDFTEQEKSQLIAICCYVNRLTHHFRIIAAVFSDRYCIGSSRGHRIHQVPSRSSCCN